MWQKLRAFSLTACVAIKGFAQSFKRDERGLSGVVVAVLLILIAVLAIGLVWTFLGEQIGAWFEEITNRASY